MTKRTPIALTFVALGAAVVVGQQTVDLPPVTFRAEVNYVEVDAVVTDGQGRPVTDLGQADFDVLEDGRPQKIGAFSVVRLPLVTPPPAAGAAGATADIDSALGSPDVVTNTAADGRIYLLVLDDLHTTMANTPRVKAFLREFLEQRFGPRDLAAVAYTSGRLAASQDFTSNRALLLQAVEKFAGRRLRSEALEIADALNRDPRDARDTAVNPSNRAGDGRDPFDPYSGLNPYEAERADRARSALGVVRDLAQLMEGVRGRRKALILVSEGVTYDVYDGFRNVSAGAVLQQATDAIGSAMRANVAIYAVDPRGLATSGDAIDLAGTSPNDPHFTIPGRILDLIRLSQQSLRDLADQTGGFAGIDNNDLAGVMGRIVQESSSYYLLGYYSSNDRRDGRFRRIEVRVRRSGVQVRSRRGYVAPRNDAPKSTPGRELDAALASPIPMSGIPMRASATAFATTTKDVSVLLTIELQADQFRFSQRDDRFFDTLEVSTSATSSAGAAGPGRQHTLDLEMRAANVALARTHGLRVISEISLPPGRHRVRIAAAERGARLAGTVFADLDVPDFRAQGLWMSGVALTSAGASEMPTIRAQDPLAQVLLSPPTTAREFGRDDVIALLSEFYDNSGRTTPQTLELSTAARSADGGRLVFEHRDERASGALENRHRYAVQIPLNAFAPGDYVVRIEGRIGAGDGMTAAREVHIRVR